MWNQCYCRKITWTKRLLCVLFCDQRHMKKLFCFRLANDKPFAKCACRPPSPPPFSGLYYPTTTSCVLKNSVCFKPSLVDCWLIFFTVSLAPVLLVPWLHTIFVFMMAAKSTIFSWGKGEGRREAQAPASSQIITPLCYVLPSLPIMCYENRWQITTLCISPSLLHDIVCHGEGSKREEMNHKMQLYIYMLWRGGTRFKISIFSSSKMQLSAHLVLS